MQDYYGNRAREYEEIYYRSDPKRQAEQVQIATTIRDLFQGTTTLEIACGTGYWTQFIGQSANRVVATDIRPEVIDLARKTKQYLSSVDFCLADAYKIPFRHDSFSGGLANFWFSHISREQIVEFLQGFHAVLTPGAQVFMADNVYIEGIGGKLKTLQNNDNTYKLRELNDGSQHLILKNYYTPEELVNIFSPYNPDFNTNNIIYGNYFWTVSYTYPK